MRDSNTAVFPRCPSPQALDRRREVTVESADGMRIWCGLAFALVELLVVLGIIALLVGLLWPALGKAHRISRATACAATLRGIDAGWVIYVQRSPTRSTPLPPPHHPAATDDHRGHPQAGARCRHIPLRGRRPGLFPAVRHELRVPAGHRHRAGPGNPIARMNVRNAAS